MRRNPLRHLGFDRRGEHLLRSLSKNLAQHLARGTDWKTDRRTANFSHGGVLRGKIRSLNNQIQPKHAAFFNSSSNTTIGYISVSGEGDVSSWIAGRRSCQKRGTGFVGASYRFWRKERL